MATRIWWGGDICPLQDARSGRAGLEVVPDVPHQLRQEGLQGLGGVPHRLRSQGRHLQAAELGGLDCLGEVPGGGQRRLAGRVAGRRA
eukprot:8694046-Alexandrium_andersonii.AAC.1